MVGKNELGTFAYNVRLSNHTRAGEKLDTCNAGKCHGLNNVFKRCQNDTKAMDTMISSYITDIFFKKKPYKAKNDKSTH